MHKMPQSSIRRSDRVEVEMPIILMGSDTRGDRFWPLIICRFAGCDLNWERRLGYFKTTTTQRTFQFGIGGKRCAIADHAFLYVSGFSSAGRLWRCAVDGCRYTEVETAWATK
jgi:hypothetical protein